jgi:hypothetical protein
MQGSAAAAEVAGPGIAGAMAQAFGAVTAVLADAVSFLVSTACLLGIRARESRTADPRRAAGLLGQIADGLRYVARDPYLRTFTLFGALGNLTLVAVQALLVVFLIRAVRVPPGIAGLLMASMGVGGVLGALCTRPVIRRLDTARAVLLCQAGTAPFGLLLPLTDQGVRLILFGLGLLVLSAGIVPCRRVDLVAGMVIRARHRAVNRLAFEGPPSKPSRRKAWPCLRRGRGVLDAGADTAVYRVAVVLPTAATPSHRWAGGTER